MAKQFNSELSTCRNRSLKRVFLFLILLGLFLTIFPTSESKADEPAHDPWYYVDTRTYKFSVPDKLQHFYGSAALGKVVGPMPALALGLTKEVYDDEYAKVGFSVKDIVADVLGIMSSQLARTDNLSLWLNWDPTDKSLMLQVGIRL